jgi:hypothetical protein
VSVTMLPDLAAESGETAERLTRLLAGERLDAAEAEYILAWALANIQVVPQLWPMTRKRIGAGTMGAKARELLSGLLDAMDRHLTLAGVLQERARDVHEETGQEPEAATGLAAVEEQLRAIRAEAGRLLRMVEAPIRWPTEEKLKEAKEEMQGGKRLSAEEFRQALLEE